MTELEFYRLAAQPLIFALAMLSFLKASWRVRWLGAAGGAAVGLVVGLAVMAAERSGAPGWIGWAVAAPLVLLALWRWRQRRRAST